MSSQRLRLTAALTACLLAVLLAVAVAGLVRSGPEDADAPTPGSATGSADAQGAGWSAATEVPAEMNPAAPAADGIDDYVLPRRASGDRPEPGGQGPGAAPVPDRARQLARAIPGSRVMSTHRSADGERIQVTLTASTDRSPRSVLRAYRARLTRWGLTETPARAAGGSVAATFAGSGAVVVVTAAAAGRTTYGVLATLSNGTP